MLKTRIQKATYAEPRFTEMSPAWDGFVGRRMGRSTTGWSAIVAEHFHTNPLEPGKEPWNISHHTLQHAFSPALCRISAQHPVREWSY